MSMAVEELAARIRPLMPQRGAVEEKRMFGGMAFMLDGNMVVCPTKEGALIVRVGKEGMAEALSLPGADRMDMNGRTMSGFVVVTGDALEDDEVLADWMGRALAFVRTLPAKSA
jgi:TfoX/Sxy family transcriptional regulator of competence genes